MSTSHESSQLKKVGVPILLGAILAVGALLLEQAHTAALLALMFTGIAFMSAKPEWQTPISVVAMLVAIAAGWYVVEEKPTDINQWYAMKIVFVVYFAVFIGHLFSLVPANKSNWLIFTLTLVMFICFVIELNSTKTLEDPVYTWAALWQDIFFGVAAAVAAQLFKPTTKP